MSFKKLCLILGSGLGIGMASYSLYYIYRRLSADDSQWINFGQTGKVFKIPMKNPSHYIRVPLYLVPRLIGTKGENIREMEAETNTVIHFENDVLGLKDPDQSGEDTTSNSTTDDDNGWQDLSESKYKKNRRSDLFGYRLMTVRGDEHNVKKVDQLVTALINENTIESMPIPDGCNVVGHDGHIINGIRDESGARLELQGSRYTTNRTILIIGNDRQRGCAKRMFTKVIDEFLDQKTEEN